EGGADQQRPPEQQQGEGEHADPQRTPPRDGPDLVDRLLDGGEGEEGGGEEGDNAEAVDGPRLVEELTQLVDDGLVGIGEDLDEHLEAALLVLVEDPGADVGKGGQERNEREDGDEGERRGGEEDGVLVRLAEGEGDEAGEQAGEQRTDRRLPPRLRRLPRQRGRRRPGARGP